MSDSIVYFTNNQREAAKTFLKAMQAKEVSRSENDTSRRIVYEIELCVDGSTEAELWIEGESKLEEPEYWYNLKRFVGENI